MKAGKDFTNSAEGRILKLFFTPLQDCGFFELCSKSLKIIIDFQDDRTSGLRPLPAFMAKYTMTILKDKKARKLTITDALKDINAYDDDYLMLETDSKKVVLSKVV